MNYFIDANIGGLKIGSETDNNTYKFVNDMDIVTKSTIFVCDDDNYKKYTKENPLKREDMIATVYLDETTHILESEHPYPVGVNVRTVGYYDIIRDHTKGNFFFMVYRGSKKS